MLDLGTTPEVERDEDSTQDHLEQSKSEAGRANTSHHARRDETGRKRFDMYRQYSRLGLEKEFGNQCACVLEDKQTEDVEVGTADPSGFSDLSQTWLV